MPKYVIEREIPGAGTKTAADLHEAAKVSCGVLKKLGPTIQWVESYVTDDKIYCVVYRRTRRDRAARPRRGLPGPTAFRKCTRSSTRRRANSTAVSPCERFEPFARRSSAKGKIIRTSRVAAWPARFA